MHGAVRNPDPAAVEATQHEAIDWRRGFTLYMLKVIMSGLGDGR
jgi:hypothetical protein